MAGQGARAHAVTESDQERVFVASQWRLMWWKFRRHRPAVASGVILLLFYLVAVGPEFLATSDPFAVSKDYHYLPPQRLHLFDGWSLRPHVYAVRGHRDPETYQKLYETDPEEKIPVRFFTRGYAYKFLGLIRTNWHLMGIDYIEERPTIYLLGTDKLGRDMWSRLMLATRISLSVGLVGVALTFSIGITLGGISGFFGGVVDTFIQRAIEVLMSVPSIPLWMGLAVAVPKDWPVVRVYFAITVIISVIGWTGLARVVRGRFLSMREEDFVTAAYLVGCSTTRIISRHMVPSFLSHIIASITLSIAGMIISETALSFLGLGLRPPAVSWGVMLQQAQNAETVALYQWLMIPAVPVIIAILAFNFVGDGLRDAADPYG